MLRITSAGQFEYWLFEMEDRLEQFLSLLPSKLATELNYSAESLDLLETWILLQYPTIEAILEPGEGYVFDGASRYVGEVFRKKLGGKWQLQFDNPKYAHYGLPEISGYSSRPTPISPYTLITAAISRKEGSYISSVLDGVIKTAK
jgi:hypothetical protein